MPEVVVLQRVTDAARAGSARALRHAVRDDLRAGRSTWEADERDLMVMLAPYQHAALALGHRRTLWWVGLRAPRSLRGAVTRFSARPSIEPSAWGFAVRTASGGAVYEREQLTTAEVAAMVRRLEDLG